MRSIGLTKEVLAMPDRISSRFSSQFKPAGTVATAKIEESLKNLE